MGTSHRQKPVRQLVGRVREGLRELFSLPDGYEVALGNGGTTAFWDAATAGLVRERALHLVYGEFSGKFAACTRGAPFLADPIVVDGRPGRRPRACLGPDRRRDRVGAQRDLHRGDGPGPPSRRVRRGAGADRRHLGGRRAARRRRATPTPTTSPPRRASPPTAGCGWRCSARRRWPGSRRSTPSRAGGALDPDFLSLTTALENSRKDQTYNTPAIATLFLLADQLDWMLERGGLDGMVARTSASSAHLYEWAQRRPDATPFVADPAKRSLVVGTIDFDDGVDAAALAATLRANGIVDVEPYRKLGRNQLRIAMFPATDPADVQALTACIDWVLERS